MTTCVHEDIFVLKMINTITQLKLYSSFSLKVVPYERWIISSHLKLYSSFSLIVVPHDNQTLNSVIIVQVYRLSVVHCQVTRYSHRVPGYLTWYSVSANEVSFDKKTANQIVSFKSCYARKKYSPSPLGDFNRFPEGLIGALCQIWHWFFF